MKYFKGVSNLAFTYGESSHDNDLPTYSDINYVRLNIDNKTIWSCIIIFLNGGPIAYWTSPQLGPSLVVQGQWIVH
jgi:hypothetical protein